MRLFGPQVTIFTILLYANQTTFVKIKTAAICLIVLWVGNEVAEFVFDVIEHLCYNVYAIKKTNAVRAPLPRWPRPNSANLIRR